MNTYDVNDLDFIKNRSRTNNFFHKDLWALALLHKGQYNSLLHFERENDKKGFNNLLNLVMDKSDDEIVVMGSDDEEDDTNVMTFSNNFGVDVDDFDDILSDEDDEKASEKKTKGKMRKKTWKTTINDIAHNNNFKPPPPPPSHQTILQASEPIKLKTNFDEREEQFQELLKTHNQMRQHFDHLSRQKKEQERTLQAEINSLRSNLKQRVDNDIVMKENQRISDLETKLQLLQVEKESLQQNFQEQLNANSLLQNSITSEQLRFKEQLKQSQFLVKQEQLAKQQAQDELQKFKDDKDRDDKDRDREFQKVSSGLRDAESKMKTMKLKLDSIQ